MKRRNFPGNFEQLVEKLVYSCNVERLVLASQHDKFAYQKAILIRCLIYIDIAFDSNIDDKSVYIY